jgi:Ca2+-binding RTX toxin-like protein
MAQLDSDFGYFRIDMFDVVRLGTVLLANATTVAYGFSSPAFSGLIITGSNLTVSGNTFTGGQITGIEYIGLEGTSLWRMTELNLSALAFEPAAAALRSANNANLMNTLLATQTWYITGSDMNDELFGGTANDVILGGLGDDALIGGAGDDILDGGFVDIDPDLDSSEDRDIIRYDLEGGTSGIIVSLDLGTVIDTFGNVDTVRNVERIVGTNLVDIFVGDDSNNDFVGRAGNDVMDGRGGNADRANYGNENGPQGVAVNLALGTATDSFGNTDTLSNIERVRGTRFNDTIIGDAARNQLEGLAGSDVLNGGDGIDGVRYDNDETFTAPNGTRGDRAVRIDLDAGFARDGFGTIDTLISIENARGTRFADRIIGTADANLLDGLGGSDYIEGGGANDTLLGGEGSDILEGGSGADSLDGGEQFDTASYAYATNGVVAGLDGWTNFGDAAGDVFTSVEGLTGSQLSDFLGGNSGRNGLWGLGGNDGLLAYGGNDWLYGGDGTDTLDGGTGDDLLVGGRGADQLIGGDGWDTASYELAEGGVAVSLLTGGLFDEAAGDTLTGIERVLGSNFDDTLTGDALDNELVGNAGADQLIGGDGNDRLIGGAGNDGLIGGTGADQLIGGTGWDTVNYSTASTGVVAGLSGWTNFGDAAGDTFSGIEAIFATNSNDFLGGDELTNALYGNGGGDGLYGYGGLDYLFGGGGADSIYGGTGDDFIEGGAGDDLLVGEAGNDVFVWTVGDGNDFIADFAGGAGVGDVIRLIGTGITDFASLQALITQTPNVNQSQIQIGGETLYIFGILPNQFSADDFLFA